MDSLSGCSLSGWPLGRISPALRTGAAGGRWGSGPASESMGDMSSHHGMRPRRTIYLLCSWRAVGEEKDRGGKARDRVQSQLDSFII